MKIELFVSCVSLTLSCVKDERLALHMSEVRENSHSIDTAVAGMPK